MKKLLLLFGILLMFGCQTEPVDIQPTNISESANFKHQLPEKADSIQIAKNVFQKRHSNGVIEITHYDYLDNAENDVQTTTDYLIEASVSPSITVGTGMELVTITGVGFGNVKGQLRWGSFFYSARWMIKSWSDTKIEAWVPANAYSSVIDIYNADRSILLASTNKLTVKYGVYPATAGYDELTWRWERISFDGPEVVWHPEIGQYNQSILDLVQQAFDAWTEVSGMNWRIGEPVAIDANSSASDGNFVFGFGPSPGAAHNSMAYQNCGDDTFKITGGRVVFDEKRDWVAALHEFGHAIGLPHTNNQGSCMITTGGKNISTWDAEGARDKVNWSIANTPSCAVQFERGTVLPTYTFYKDNDSDGYGGTITVQAETAPDGYVSTGGDCNDNDPSINPGATEILDNNVDENCDGVIGVTPTYTYYLDNDSDSYGQDNFTITSTNSTTPSGYARRGGDCDDTNATIHPNAIEILDNGIDEDCDGSDLTSASYVNGIYVPSTFSGSKLKVNITGSFAIDKVEIWYNGQLQSTQSGYQSGTFFVNFDRKAPNGNYILKFSVYRVDIVVEKPTTKISKGGGPKGGPKR